MLQKLFVNPKTGRFFYLRCCQFHTLTIFTKNATFITDNLIIDVMQIIGSPCRVYQTKKK